MVEVDIDKKTTRVRPPPGPNLFCIFLSDIWTLRTHRQTSYFIFPDDPRTRAFISHTGLNSYLESSYAGVPILAIPLFADQPHNAKSGESIGTTYVLDKTQLTTPNIVKGLKAVLYDTRWVCLCVCVSVRVSGCPHQNQ